MFVLQCGDDGSYLHDVDVVLCVCMCVCPGDAIVGVVVSEVYVCVAV